MSRLVASFDPSAGSGTFQAGAVNRCSVLWVMNESPNFLQLDFGGAGTTKIVQPWYNMQIQLSNPVQTVNWSVLASLQSGSAPVSMVYVELFDPAETVTSLLSGPLFRQSNVGNAAAVSSSAVTIQNDGNAAGSTVIEATPSGAGSSQLLWRNDGSGTFGGGLATVDNAGVFTLPANAIPGASVGGAVTEAESLNNQVTSSDNGTAQLYSTVNGRGIALGYKDSGGTYHEVLTINTDGTVTAATLHGTADNATSATVAQYLAANSGAGGFLSVDDSTGGNTRLEPSANRDTILGYRDTSGVYHDTLQLNQYGFQILAQQGIYPGLGGGLYGINKISGSGSATVNHGLAKAPDAAVVNTNNGSNSTTYGSGSYTSSTVYIYQYNAQPWTGIVYRAEG